MTKSVAVIGLGYVGLPLALLAAKKGYTTVGLDVDSNKIESLEAGKSYIDDVSGEDVAKSGVEFTTDASKIKGCDVVVICVPTPVTHSKEPDLGPVKGAVTSISKHLKKGALVVVESTVNPGVCDEVVAPLLESLSGKKIGKDIYLAHCPERINPGDPRWNVTNINRVVGANSKKELNLAKNFYESIIDAQIKPMASLKEAEAVKIVENSFRDINIAFVNELAMSFAKMGLNIRNVIEGAATKPFAFMAHYPGIGVGGHCIPVDPYYLIDYAKSLGFEHKFLTLARSINEGMPIFAIECIEQALKEKTSKDTLAGCSVLVLGLSYKAGVADDRESPSYRVIEELKKRGAATTVYDPYFAKKSDAPTLAEALKGKEVIVLATAHPEFLDLSNYTWDDCRIFFDGRGAFAKDSSQFTKAGVHYIGIQG